MPKVHKTVPKGGIGNHDGRQRADNQDDSRRLLAFKKLCEKCREVCLHRLPSKIWHMTVDAPPNNVPDGVPAVLLIMSFAQLYQAVESPCQHM
jgi:hypothetical protein